jgi:hypothetical protein
MKTCSQIRYENARRLIEEEGGPAAFAKKITDPDDEKSMTPQQVNSWGGPNPRRNIGDEIARRIEIAFEKEEGWLDHEWDVESSINGHMSALSDEAKSLIFCVERLDAAGDVARKTFIYHTGLLLLSSASAALQTGSVVTQMLEQLEQTRASTHSESSGATNGRKIKK